MLLLLKSAPPHKKNKGGWQKQDQLAELRQTQGENKNESAQFLTTI